VLELIKFGKKGGRSWWSVNSRVLYTVFFFTFWLRIQLKEHKDEAQGHSLAHIWHLLLELWMILLVFTETLFYLRTYKRFGKLVQLVWLVLWDLIPFCLFFMLGICMFSAMFYLLHVKFDSLNYPNIHPFMLVLIQTYRNSVGSSDLPDDSYWISE